MGKSLTDFVCQNCEARYAKWQGQCEQCGEWNSLVEEVKPVAMAGVGGKRTKIGALGADISGSYQPFLQQFSDIKHSTLEDSRISTCFEELDRVLGGGLVPGAVVLIGGEPGIGKSTLLTQVVIERIVSNAGAVAQLTKGGRSQKSEQKNLASKLERSVKSEIVVKPKSILYVSGEESPSQISLRINRYLNNEYISSKSSSGLYSQKVLGEALTFLTTTNVDSICAVIHDTKPQLVIVDSIQTLTTTDLTGVAGSIGQLRESADRLTQVAKANNIPIFLVGHVTKEGTIAGPKVLEHIVDCVLEVSGERIGSLRLIRAIKNRFGATDEVGVFQHSEYGLEEVTNPSALFLEQSNSDVPGSITVCVMEGTRPLLAEVQSLVVTSQLSMPRRVGRGIELSRIQVLAAVLQKHCNLPLGVHDIFVNAAGGFTIREPAADLGLAVAMASSLMNKKIPQKIAFVGEVGLLGEIRKVSYLDRRIKEAKRLGYTTIYSRDTHTSLRSVLRELGLLKGSN